MEVVPAEDPLVGGTVSPVQEVVETLRLIKCVDVRVAVGAAVELRTVMEALKPVERPDPNVEELFIVLGSVVQLPDLATTKAAAGRKH